jgi:hypothetical protein
VPLGNPLADQVGASFFQTEISVNTRPESFPPRVPWGPHIPSRNPLFIRVVGWIPNRKQRKPGRCRTQLGQAQKEQMDA